MLTPCIRRIARCGLSAIAWAATACFATNIPVIEVHGRLAVSEPHTCDGGTWPDFLETNSTTDWTTCHADKQHMDSSGAAITTNAFVPDAIRPLQATIQLEIWCTYLHQTASDVAPIASVRVQTNSGGRFGVKLPRSTCGNSSLVADGVVLRSSVWLEYRIDESPGVPAGTVRALWDPAVSSTIYRSVLPPDPPVWGPWVVPHLILGQQILPVRPPSSVDLGNMTFLEGTSPSYTGSLRGILGSWQTMVNLHQRLQAALAVDGHDALYRQIFITDPATACASCYSVYFNTTGAGYGGRGAIALPGPDATDPLWNYLSQVSIGLPGHEFGHSMHAGIAPASFVPEDRAWILSEDSAGGIEYGRLPLNGPRVQSQDMGMSLVEGFGDAMGAYFLRRCAITDRGWGDPDPAQSTMNPAAHAACDATDTFCPYRQFRYQMTERGIAEGSPTWIARMKALDTIARNASNAGAILALSNNEAKVANVFCDLLDNDPDVSYATGQVGGRSYVPDFDWLMAEAIDGRIRTSGLATYAADPPPETVTLTLGTMLDALQGFVTTSYAGPLPSPIVDGANGAYDDVRMSVLGPYSVQALARYLVTRGVATRADMNGILSGNRMEEIP